MINQLIHSFTTSFVDLKTALSRHKHNIDKVINPDVSVDSRIMYVLRLSKSSPSTINTPSNKILNKEHKQGFKKILCVS